MFKLTKQFSLGVFVAAAITSAWASAHEPVFSLDLLSQHPYRFVPAYGHASQNPGSPKWFRPGYGYQIPGFGYSVAQPRVNFYHYTVPHRLTTAGKMYWEQGRSPWYLPSAPETAAFPLQSMGW